ncbi:LANO_0F00584g1_1 [Lachancea nothofagi CBS 11611]|uniref:Palmitoyltransferase n=1 Tax=Lachancea nothofagi CBS 11611 TaxID=1266666 RepID=A0A1G4K5I8_9SACH|nr:LANO_0F00584g1_1 [Lachancea nothofagi CBS 11611]
MWACSSIASTFPKCLTTFLFLYTGITTVLYVEFIPFGIVLILIGASIVLNLYTYFKIIRVGAGSSTEFPDLKIANLEAAEQGLEFPPKFLTQRSVTLKRNGRFRFCRECVVWKPDRCHHCSACNKCHLKMDHHCPWFAVCIGFRNQKYFIQFLLYALTYSVLVFFFTGADLFIWFRSRRYEHEVINLSLLVVWLLSVIITISVAAFTGHSIYLITKNQTVIEMYEWNNYKSNMNILDESRGTITSIDTNMFDLGSASRNWESVMGETWLEWLLPIQAYAQVKNRHTLDESGLYFRVNGNMQGQVSGSMILQEQLMRRLTPRSSYGDNELRPPDMLFEVN